MRSRIGSIAPKGGNRTPAARILNPVNDKLIDALFSVSSRIRDIRWEMERLTDDGSEKDDPELPSTFESTDRAIPSTRKELRRSGIPTNESGPRDGPVSRIQTGTQLIITLTLATCTDDALKQELIKLKASSMKEVQNEVN